MDGTGDAAVTGTVAEGEMVVGRWGSASAARDEGALLREFVSGRDVLCPMCGYSLRDLLTGRCPECGEELCLRINLAEPKMRAYIAGLVGLSVGLGFSGLLLVWVGYMVAARGGGPGLREVAPLLLQVAVEAPVFVWWMRKGAWIRRRSKESRVWLAAGCWALTLVLSGIFMVTVR